MRQNPFQTIYDNQEYSLGKTTQFPFIVDVEPTNHCNLNCQMCDRGTMTRTQGFMSDDVFFKIVNECLVEGTPIRLIGWGEPFLHPKIIDFVKQAKGLSIHITNNGQIISEQQMKDLVDLELDSIIFSFQGATPKGYELMRRGASYSKIKDAILQLIQIRGVKDKPFIHVSSTMTNETKEEIDKFVAYWEKLVDSVGIGKTNLHDKTVQTYRPCLEVYRKLTVKWDGQVSACCGDSDNKLIIGNIKNNTLKAIWEGEQLKAIRTLLSHRRFESLTLCKDCFYAYNF